MRFLVPLQMIRHLDPSRGGHSCLRLRSHNPGGRTMCVPRSTGHRRERPIVSGVCGRLCPRGRSRSGRHSARDRIRVIPTRRRVPGLLRLEQDALKRGQTSELLGSRVCTACANQRAENCSLFAAIRHGRPAGDIRRVVGRKGDAAELGLGHLARACVPPRHSRW